MKSNHGQRSGGEKPGARQILGLASSWEAVIAGTALLALTISLGPLLGAGPVAVSSMVWIGIASFTLVVKGVRFLRSPSWVTAVVVVGVGFATLRMTSLGLVRTFGNRPALFWNVDWGYHATQAHGIARFFGVSDSLDYAGQPLEYHAGPAWIAGALDRAIGLPAPTTLFLILPLLVMPMLAYWLVRLLRVMGVGRDVAWVTVALAVNLPTSLLIIRQLVKGSFGVLTDAEHFWFTSNLMLNSFLALLPGLLGLCLVLDGSAKRSVRLMGAVALGATAGLKPQYFIGLVAVAFVISVVSAIRRTRTLRDGRTTFLIVCLAAFIGIVLIAGTPTTQIFGSVKFVNPFPSLLTLNSLLTVWVWVVLVAVGVTGTAVRKVSYLDTRVAIGVILTYSIFTLALGTTIFEVSEVRVDRARMAGLPMRPDSQDANISQIELPLVLLLTALGLSFIVRKVMASRPFWLWSLAALVIVGVTPMTISPLIWPTGSAAYEWTEERDVATLMAMVDGADGLWLSSDLADAAQNHQRPLRAISLTSHGEQQFYLANVAYGGWAQEDVVERMANTESFFGARWSEWHDEFLSRARVGFILTNYRCPARWSDTDVPATRIHRSGGWTLFELPVNPDAVVGQPTNSGMPARPQAQKVHALYGKSPCLGER